MPSCLKVTCICDFWVSFNLNFSHGKFRKVMESHGILKVSKSTNPDLLFYNTKIFFLLLVVVIIN